MQEIQIVSLAIYKSREIGRLLSFNHHQRIQLFSNTIQSQLQKWPLVQTLKLEQQILIQFHFQNSKNQDQ